MDYRQDEIPKHIKKRGHRYLNQKIKLNINMNMKIVC